MSEYIHGGKTLTKDSKFMDKIIKDCRLFIMKEIETKMKVKLLWEKDIKLSTIVNQLKINFPKEQWTYKFKSSSIRPDGGILYLKSLDNNNLYPILITEMKKQGTNDRVITETGKKQASGNAIERLGKNVIGFRTWLSNESIFPFVCFGWGWDFNPDCSILDRVVTIAEFGELNKTHLYNTEKTNRGSFYFNTSPLTQNKMQNIMLDVAKRSILYYFSKYGEENFREDI